MSLKEKSHSVSTYMPLLWKFIGKAQLATMVAQSLHGQEREWFLDKLLEMADLFTKMHSTGKQDGVGDRAIVHLHYFLHGHDWYITEKDCVDDEPQHQAFGYACLDGGYPELGYISIQELIDNGVELDLFWEPITLREVKADRDE